MNDNIGSAIPNAAPLQNSLLNSLVLETSTKLVKNYELRLVVFDVMLVGPLAWD